MKTIKGYKKLYEISISDCYWSILCRMEEKPTKLNHDEIQNTHGVYIFWGWKNKPIRIGKAVTVRNRIISYCTSHKNQYVFSQMENEIAYISVIYTLNQNQSQSIELDLIRRHKPKYNKILYSS